MNLPCLVVVTSDALAVANGVFGALASGSRQIIARLTDQPNPNENATPTHYYMMDMSALDTDVAEWQAMTAGDPPQIIGTWGEGGIPTAGEMQSALTGGAMQVYSAAEIDTAGPFVDGVLDGAGLYPIPDAL